MDPTYEVKRNFFQQYVDSFRGLSREVWILAFVTLINRAGTMVLPFLTIYLNNDLEFSLSQVGSVMTAFGFGSMVGNYIGGRLTDHIGSHKIMITSLALTGLGFIGLQYIDDFTQFVIAVFLLISVADTFRPAMFVAMSMYSKPENKTRSVTLIRLAINLGFSAGPALGGLIIGTLGYSGLFWVDGITCISAAIAIMILLHPKKTKIIEEPIADNPVSVYSDKIFWWFFLSVLLYAFVFLQLFSTIPLYFRNQLGLEEWKIGLLMTLNGLIIFFLEMPLIKKIQDKYSNYSIIIIGCVLTTLAFLMFNMSAWIGATIFAIMLISFGEMLALPFGNTFALSRAKMGKQGEFMAWYSMAFSMAHILSHKVTMRITEVYGFTMTWYFVVGIGVLCVIVLFYSKYKWKL